MDIIRNATLFEARQNIDCTGAMHLQTSQIGLFLRYIRLHTHVMSFCSHFEIEFHILSCLIYTLYPAGRVWRPDVRARTEERRYEDAEPRSGRGGAHPVGADQGRAGGH